MNKVYQREWKRANMWRYRYKFESGTSQVVAVLLHDMKVYRPEIEKRAKVYKKAWCKGNIREWLKKRYRRIFK